MDVHHNAWVGAPRLHHLLKLMVAEYGHALHLFGARSKGRGLAGAAIIFFDPVT